MQIIWYNKYAPAPSKLIAPFFQITTHIFYITSSIPLITNCILYYHFFIIISPPQQPLLPSPAFFYLCCGCYWFHFVISQYWSNWFMIKTFLLTSGLFFRMNLGLQHQLCSSFSFKLVGCDSNKFGCCFYPGRRLL